MPRRVTMSDLRTVCLRNVDLEKDKSFVTAEANRAMSLTYGNLYSEVAKTGLRYFERSTSITTTGLSYIAEPVDHLATVDTIERVVDATTGRSRRLRQLMPQERTYWLGRTGNARRWEMVDERINLYPAPPAGDVYVIRYIPQPPDLTNYNDSDYIDVVTSDGEDFMVWGTGVRLLGKSKSDVTLCMKERDDARERLSEWAALRQFNDSPRTIVDDDDDDDFPWRDGSYWYDR